MSKIGKISKDSIAIIHPIMKISWFKKIIKLKKLMDWIQIENNRNNQINHNQSFKTRYRKWAVWDKNQIIYKT